MYVGQVYTKAVAGVVVWPAVEVTKGYMVGVVWVADCTGAVWAVFVALAA